MANISPTYPGCGSSVCGKRVQLHSMQRAMICCTRASWPQLMQVSAVLSGTSVPTVGGVSGTVACCVGVLTTVGAQCQRLLLRQFEKKFVLPPSTVECS